MQGIAIMAGLPEIRMEVAQARAELRAAKDVLEFTRAEIEQQAIDQANGNIGKNEAERTRHLTLALAQNNAYRAVLNRVRRAEAEVDRLEALLEGARDARRIEEWQIRARLADALLGVPSDSTDPYGDAGFDDVALHDVSNRLAARAQAQAAIDEVFGV